MVLSFGVPDCSPKWISSESSLFLFGIMTLHLEPGKQTGCEAGDHKRSQLSGLAASRHARKFDVRRTTQTASCLSFTRSSIAVRPPRPSVMGVVAPWFPQNVVAHQGVMRLHRLAEAQPLRHAAILLQCSQSHPFTPMKKSALPTPAPHSPTNSG